MKLPFITKFSKKSPSQYFLLLLITEEKVNAVIFEESDGKAQLTGHKEEFFESSIDKIAPDDLLRTLDKAISSAESSLPENIQTQKTIFAVKEEWTENDQIKKDYLDRLKSASKELGLTPVGFLVISQAISHLLQKEEGAPVSAVFVETDHKSLTVSLIRAGKLIESKSSEIHEPIPFTVDTLLKHFDVPEILPSRIVVINGKAHLKQEFLSHTWSKSLPFLHLPEITVLPPSIDIKAALYGACAQMGFEVSEHNLPQRHTQRKKEEPSLGSSALFSDAKDFGFHEGEDVARPAPEKIDPIKEEPINDSLKTPDFQQKNIDEIPHFPKKEESVKKPFALSVFNKIPFLIKRMNIAVIFSIFKIPRSKKGFLLPGLAALIIMFSAYYFFLTKATIEIIVDPQIVEKNENVLFSAINRTDPQKNILKGEFVEISVDGKVSLPTTGEKDVGTFAEGKITIFNSLTEPKTLAKGTTLESPNGLLFTLDSETTVQAVASHSADETVPPAKITANVTASALGKESNLPSGTKFIVSDFNTSDLIGKNDEAFEGGTKKQIQVVSINDESELEEELTKQLEEKALTDLQSQIGENKILLSSFLSNSIGKSSLSSDVGDESEQVTLTGTVTFQGISYDKNDLISFSKLILEKEVSGSQEIDYNNIKTSVNNIESQSDDEIEAGLNIKALLLPKIDKEKIAEDFKGKSFKEAENAIYSMSQIADVKILFNPNIFFLPKNLPMIKDNIRVLIKLND
jgi:hypothetical protein